MTVAGTDGVLIVSIPRRTYKAVSGSIYNLPQVFNMSNLPHHAFGLETLNDMDVRTNYCLTIGSNAKDDDKYSKHLFIKSVVALKEREDNNTSFIYGSKTYIFNYDNDDATNNGTIRVYDPITTSFTSDFKPVRKINEDPTGTNNIEEDKIKDFITNQTIIIYTNEINNDTKMEVNGVDIRTFIKDKYSRLITMNNMTDNSKYVGDSVAKDTAIDVTAGSVLGIFDLAI
jgi:hypothetical protein